MREVMSFKDFKATRREVRSLIGRHSDLDAEIYGLVDTVLVSAYGPASCKTPVYVRGPSGSGGFCVEIGDWSQEGELEAVERSAYAAYLDGEFNGVLPPDIILAKPPNKYDGTE